MIYEATGAPAKTGGGSPWNLQNLRELVENTCAAHADNVAYMVKDEKGGPYRDIKYSELERDIAAVGTALIEKGIINQKIAIMGENCYEWVVVYLASMNSGNVAMPMDRELNPDEVELIINAAECKVAFYTETSTSKFDGLDLDHRIIMSMYGSHNLPPDLTDGTWAKFKETGEKLLDAGIISFSEVAIDSHAMASLIFTSGTTGTPKGVMLSAFNIVSDVEMTGEVVNVGEDDRVLSILPIHHTFESNVTLLGMLYRGGSVAFFEGLKYVNTNMQEARPTLMLGVPLIFESIYSRIWKQAKKRNKDKALKRAISLNKKLNNMGIDMSKKLFKSIHEQFGGRLRVMLCGAAAIDPNVLKGFYDIGITFLQGYGLTEASPLATGTAISPMVCRKPGSAGPPLPRSTVKIVDPNEEGIGEIVYKGPNVMLGYYNMPEETAQTIRDGWLYTGDYGFLTDDGWLYITGRKKNIIVTKTGKNIYPEELEGYLNHLDFVEESMVYGYETDTDDEVLVAAQVRPDYEQIRAEHGDDYSDEQIKKLIESQIMTLNGKLPNYKWVRKIDIRETEFIKTTTKKIKRHASLEEK